MKAVYRSNSVGNAAVRHYG